MNRFREKKNPQTWSGFKKEENKMSNNWEVEEKCCMSQLKEYSQATNRITFCRGRSRCGNDKDSWSNFQKWVCETNGAQTNGTDRCWLVNNLYCASSVTQALGHKFGITPSSKSYARLIEQATWLRCDSTNTYWCIRVNVFPWVRSKQV